MRKMPKEIPHYTSIRLAKIKKNEHTKWLVRLWRNWNAHILLVGMEKGTTSLEIYLVIS